MKIQWWETLGSNQLDRGLAGLQTRDGGYLVGGWIGVFNDPSRGRTQAHYVRIGADLGELSSAEFGNSWGDWVSAVAQTRDGGFLIGAVEGISWAGSVTSLNRVSPQGTPLWSRVFGNHEDPNQIERYEIRSVLETRDGRFLAVGSIQGGRRANGLLEHRGFSLLFDAGGELLRTHILDGFHVILHSVREAANGALLVAGISLLPEGMLLIQFDRAGNESWRTFATFDETPSQLSPSWPGGMCRNLEGDVFVLGTVTRASTGQDVYVMKFDATGSEQWRQFLGGNARDVGESIHETPDGGVVVVGSTHSMGAGKSDVYLFKLDPAGQVLWEATAGGPSDDFGADVDVTEDGGFFVVGSTRSFGNDMYLLKFLEVETPPQPPEFIRGDCNGDGSVEGDVSDAIHLLLFNFVGGEEPPCLAACDANADGDVEGSVTDAVHLLLFNFLGGPPPGEPFPHCGGLVDDADVNLGCEEAPEGCVAQAQGR